MRIIEWGDYLEITDIEDINLEHTFYCGQCFRWERRQDGKYFGVAYGRPLSIWCERGNLYMDCSREEFELIWRKYLDLDRNYTEITKLFGGNDFFVSAVEFGRGLRLLAQEPWEALCSFIISQCNNINRIKKIVDTLCSNFGERVENFYIFPTADRIASLTLEDLASLRAGYRAKYILSAAKAVANGELDFGALALADTETARKEIMKREGVGRKVADCFLLYGLCKYDAFPVDTWMKKAESYYGGAPRGADFGQYAGIAQQYIFYYSRSGKGI